MLTTRFARFTRLARRWRLHAAVALSLAFAIGAAPATHAADKTKVKTTVTVAPDLNPNRNGRPSPVALIMFQLKSAEGFKNADFFSLMEPNAPVLGGDVIERTQLILQPGESMPLEPEFDEDARYVGFVAAFRDIENAQWRALIELPKKGFFKSFFTRTKLNITLEKLAVTASLK